MRFKQALMVFFTAFLIVGLIHSGYAQESKPESDPAGSQGDQQKRKPQVTPVKVPGKTLLPLRILARPLSNVYKEADEKSDIVEENVPVFQSYFVYTCPKTSIEGTEAEGWYEVGTDNRGTILGWMKAEDVMEWKQSMCLAYEHPEGRKPVLMFEKLDALQKLVKSPSEERKKAAEAYYQTVDSKKFPKDFPIISMEPKDAIDIKEQFYLLPILEYAPIDIEGREGRLLKLASATKSERGGATLKNPEGGTVNLEGNTIKPEANPVSKAKLLKKLEMDIVYVVDMTRSMHPYIKATLEAVNDMTKFITQDAEVEKSVKFGFWGYRDSMDIPGIEFHTRNFTSKLLPVQEFEKILADIEKKQERFTTGSEDYPEDVFSGIDKAMQETKWTEDALHIIVLVGDAPSHEPGHKWNYSGASATTLRTFADDNKFSIFSLHIKEPKAQDYWDLAEEQFRTLSKNRGVNDASYCSVQSTEMNEFAQATQTIAGDLVNMVKAAKKGDMKEIVAAVQTGSPQSDSSHSSSPQADDSVKSKVANMGYAALVDWLGREGETKAPRDIIAWVTDKDLIEPAVQSLNVRILVNKKQLDSLKTVLQEIMTAGRRGIIGGDKFFSQLQAVPSAASRGGDQIKNAISLADTGLIPEFMHDLPYQSQIMGLSNDLWGSWSPDQQEEFLNEIDTKIKLYASIHDNPKSWIPLNKGDDMDEYVCAVSLEALP